MFKRWLDTIMGWFRRGGEDKADPGRGDAAPRSPERRR